MVFSNYGTCPWMISTWNVASLYLFFSQQIVIISLELDGYSWEPTFVPLT